VEIQEGKVPRYKTTAKGKKALGYMRELRNMIPEPQGPAD
jgi:predicted transcriptional regulator